jgi:hypothetical protein
LGGTAGARICLRDISHMLQVVKAQMCLTLRWLCRVLIRERDFELEQSAFPDRLIFAGDAAVPLLQIHHSVGAAHRFRKEAERVVASPLPSADVRGAIHELWGCLKRIPLFRQSVHAKCPRHLAV